MDESDPELFGQIRSFAWHERKRESNLRRHKIDFYDVRGIFNDYTYIRRSDRYGEVRYQVFGYLDRREVTVICTLRGDQCWIISARRTRKNERKRYYGRIPGRTAQRQD